MMPKLRALLTHRKPPLISFVVIAYDMDREIRRTLTSLTTSYQQKSEALSYEVIVVDNGSPTPIDSATVAAFGPQFTLLRIDNASPSPAAAINLGAAQARGEHVAILIDGARMLSPGVLYWTCRAFTLAPRAIACTLGFHLGPEHQRDSARRGYSKDVEDRLLERIDWPTNGYRLFEVSSLAGSSKYGWHAPLAESNCIAMHRSLFEELGGYDEKFTSAGGGLVNLDFYKRACESPDTELFYLSGEGCFHQLHGGVTTGGQQSESNRYHHLQKEYEDVRGQPHRVPQRTPTLLGSVQPAAVPLVARGSVGLAENNLLNRQRSDHFAATGLADVPLAGG